MFTNCPFCESLVATDPATDLPPERCPRCAERLRDLPTDPPAPPPSAPLDTAGEPARPVFDLLEVPAPEVLAAAAPPVLPASGLATQVHQDVTEPAPEPAAAPATGPIAPIATLLRARPPKETRPEPDPEPQPQPESEPEPEPEPGITARTEPAPAPPPAATAPPPEPEPAPREEAPPAEEPAATDRGPATPLPVPPTAHADNDSTPAAAGAPDDIDTSTRPVDDTDAVDDADDADGPEAAIDNDGEDGDGRVDDDAAETVPAQAPPAAVTAASPAPRPATTTPTAKALPSFARRRRGHASSFDWKSGAAIAGLALLLVLQLLLADRARLAGDARWRPLLANTCGVLGCSLPPWREPGAFSILARDVRPHPSTPGALRVTATFRNDARWPQPWPRIQLTLSDVNGNAVAARDFEARDYLGAAPEQAELRSGQSASIAVDVQEPATRSVAFDFELH